MKRQGLRDQRRGRRRTHVLALTAVAVLIPFAVLAAVAVHVSTTAVRDQTELRLAAAASAGAVAVNEQTTGMVQLVTSYAERQTLRNTVSSYRDTGTLDTTAVRFHLNGLQRARAGATKVFLADERGVLLDEVPEAPTIVGQSDADRDWYQGAAKTRGAYLSAVYHDPTPGTGLPGSDLVIAAAAPIRSATDAQEPVIGYIAVAYSVNTIERYVEDFAGAQGVEIEVFDQRGTVVAMPEGNALPPPRSNDPLLTAALDGRAGQGERGTGNSAQMVSYAPVAKMGWSVRAQVRTEAALIETEHTRTVVLSAAGLAAIVAASGLMLLSRSLRRRQKAEADLVVSEKNLRRSEAHLNLSIDVAQLGLWEWDAASDRLSWTKNFAEMHHIDVGASDAETKLARVQLDTMMSADLDRVRLVFVEALEGGSDLDVEYRITTPAGETRWIEVRGKVERDEHGEATRIVGVATDMTDRHLAAEELRESRDEANRANKAKSEFLSRVSHELRTPLNSVLGFAQLLELDPLTEDQAEDLRFITSGGKHLLGLINDVLDVAQIETGEMRLSLEPIGITEVVRSAVDLIHPQAAAAGITIHSDIDDQISVAFAQADRQRLLQIMLNLLSNAVKYNRPSGEVFITGQCSGGTVSISVTDTGLGVPSGDLERLFVPFERLGAERIGVEGSGVGLGLSRLLAQQMGGSLTVASTTGEGSTFTVELLQAPAPTEVADETPTVDRAPNSASTRPIRVLYIDDNVTNVRLIQQALDRLDSVELITAMHGNLGFELAKEHYPELILLDLHLPDVRGEEVLRRLKNDPITAAIPVIICSADVDRSQAERLAAFGADAFLTKPVDLDRLYVLVDQVRGDEAPLAATSGSPTRRSNPLIGTS